MKRKHGWLIILVVAALLLAACGPTATAPTSGGATEVAEVATEKPAATATQAEEPSPAEPTSTAADTSEPPARTGDWHVQGSPDAPVTIIEYSDFQ